MVVKQKEILESNRLFHNQYVDGHDRANSYISKINCKKFYEKLFLKIIKKENVRLKKANVLEFGCGTGNFLEFLLAQNIAKYIGIDISEKMIERAKEKALEINSSANISFYTIAAEDFIKEMKAKKKKFDVIFSCSFLHHLFNPESFLRSLEDVLMPDGIYIALHEPNMFAENKLAFVKYVDGLLAYLLGYDTTDSSVLLRIKKTVKRLMASLGRPNCEKDLDYVDYQLNFTSFNPLKIMDVRTNQNIHIYTELYSYFVFDYLKKFSKSPNNYFYLVIKNKNSP